MPSAATPAGRLDPLRVRLDPRHLGLLATASLLRQALLRRPERRAAPLRGPQMLGQLIATILAEQPVLPAVGLLGLLEDVCDQLLVGAIRATRRVGADLGPIDRDHPDLHQARLAAQRQHRSEQLAERPLMPTAELRDRRMIRDRHRGDQLVGDVLAALPLDPARRPVPARVRVDQQRDHHRRFVRSAPLTILSIRPIERAQIHLIDRPQDRPHHMIVRHPVRQIRRQQHRLPPVASDEVLSHTEWLHPGRHAFARQPPPKAGPPVGPRRRQDRHDVRADRTNEDHSPSQESEEGIVRGTV